MKLLILLFSSLLFAHTFFVSSPPSPDLQIDQAGGGLQFSNITGPGCQPGEVTFFIDKMNFGSSVYGIEFGKSLEYVSDQMSEKFSSMMKYTIILDAANSRRWSWYVHSSEDEYASVSSGVDIYFPLNSFLFLANNGSLDSDYVSINSTGSGVSQSEKEAIQSVIKANESYLSCYCPLGDVKEIGNRLTRINGKKWSVVCSNLEGLRGWVYSHNHQYYYGKPATVSTFCGQLIVDDSKSGKRK